ncbi:hypothetical protein SAMN04487906_0921 [Zhouia amylolytica]|uniref:Lipoprotein n=2 Tax=Zhouia amylolytica TaxID=376730 RepID=W2UP11_9FLAO|nr:hypothetical protein [Zhouia amylolytica]ETN95684.1 hypothetical protein P278_14070 [Zhouia amylolytica AD3]MCQ0112148.1 hypothetical protein [Zhouia amylolytica]SFS56626.1 hypothetical protein SAMN04487906_0921 [Zhouia amylolytica]
MKTSLHKYFALAVLAALVVTVFSCQPQQKEAAITVDLSNKKLKPEQAKKISKKFVTDIESLFQAQDSLEYYKRLLKEVQLKAEGKDPAREEMTEMAMAKNKFKLSVSSWYSVDELQSYINESIKKADTLGYSVDGFRIYIGVFPDEDQYGSKKNTLTTFITPTGVRNVQKGSFMMLPPPSSDDIEEVDPIEYGGQRDPPDAPYGS